MSSIVRTTKDLRFVDIECFRNNYMDRLDHKTKTDRLKFISHASKECHTLSGRLIVHKSVWCDLDS